MNLYDEAFGVFYIVHPHGGFKKSHSFVLSTLDLKLWSLL